jgi:ferredoxin-nitrite reductase
LKNLQEAFNNRNTKVNKIEKVKELKTPQEAFEKLDYYAKNGYNSISDEDLSFFLKCFGIFDRPATPKQFMIRVRIPGGQLSQEQAIVVGELARDFGRDYIDITTRMQVEYRYLNIEDIPTIMKKLTSVGISTYQTGVDNFRNILNDPLDDLGLDNILPSQNLLMKMQSLYLEDFEWIAALPRKFNTAITGSLSNRSNAFGQDCCFVLAQKDGVYGYNLYLGGKVGIVAKSADIFLKDESEVMRCYESLIELFRDFGFRDNRNKNRLYFLIETVGIETLSEAIRTHSGIDFDDAGETMTTMDFSDPDHGKVALRDGTFGVHVVVPSGVFSGTDLLDAAQASKMYGNGEIRFDVEQSLYIMGVRESNLDQLLHHKLFETYKSVHSPYFNHLVACAGTEHCPFGVIPNKPDAIEMAEYLTKEVPLDDGRVRMYWSACVKGCGIHGIGDIGFEGCKAKLDGKNGYGVHIFLGGKLSSEGNEGYTVMKSIPLTYANLFVASLMREYKRMKRKNQTFESYHDKVLSHYSHSAIGFIIKLLTYIKEKNLDITIGFEKNIKTGHNEVFEIFELGRHLYHQLVGHEPFESIENFTALSHDKIQEPIKTDSSIDKNLSNLVYAMLHPKLDQRAVVFSELEEHIKIYN